MSSADAFEERELVVGPNGSIPADQLAGLGIRPGAHLRVVPEPVGKPHRSAWGILTGETDLALEDFKAASRLAVTDAQAGAERDTLRVVA